MARRSLYWVVVLVVLLVGVSAAAMVSAAAQAAPTFSDRFEETKKMGRDQAVKIKGHLDAWKDWAMKTSGDWTQKKKEPQGYGAKAAETLRSSTLQTHETVTGTFSKWSAWAKEKAGGGAAKAQPKKNPAAEAVSYINSHMPGSSDSKDDEL